MNESKKISFPKTFEWLVILFKLKVLLTQGFLKKEVLCCARLEEREQGRNKNGTWKGMGWEKEISFYFSWLDHIEGKETACSNVFTLGKKPNEYMVENKLLGGVAVEWMKGYLLWFLFLPHNLSKMGGLFLMGLRERKIIIGIFFPTFFLSPISFLPHFLQNKGRVNEREFMYWYFFSSTFHPYIFDAAYKKFKKSQD